MRTFLHYMIVTSPNTDIIVVAVAATLVDLIRRHITALVSSHITYITLHVLLPIVSAYALAVCFATPCTAHLSFSTNTTHSVVSRIHITVSCCYLLPRATQNRRQKERI